MLAWCYWTISLTWNGDASKCVFFEGVFLLMSCEFHPGTQPTLPWELHHFFHIFSPTKTGEIFCSEKHTFFSISSNFLDVQDSCTKGIGFDPQRNIWEMCAKVFGWEVDKLWSCYCLVSMDIIPQMEICMQHNMFVNLKYRFYFFALIQMYRWWYLFSRETTF